MIAHIDHLVLTVQSLDSTCECYERVLGFKRVDHPDRPTALTFGTCKINVHQYDRTFEPTALRPTPGSADFCLITEEPLAVVQQRLLEEQVAIEEGPTARSGARGPMLSLYFRDPDGNLIEVSRYD